MNDRMVRVKICGMTTVDDARMAEEFGADAIGVVVFSDSPRSVPLSRAREIFSSLGPFIAKVAVTHTRSPEDLQRIMEISPDLVQVSYPHGFRTPKTCIRVIGPGDTIPSDCAAVIVDASHGRGIPFDAEYARRVVRESRVPVILAGGLRPGTVANAIRETGAYAVDVATGVEQAPGVKDPSLVKAFLHECRKSP